VPGVVFAVVQINDGGLLSQMCPIKKFFQDAGGSLLLMEAWLALSSGSCFTKLHTSPLFCGNLNAYTAAPKFSSLGIMQERFMNVLSYQA
jgi:hypothetical protein